MTPTLGDFLTLARQHLNEAAQRQDDLPVTAHAGVIVELDRLLNVLARYSREGLREPGTEPARPIPSLPELTKAGVGVLIERAAENWHRLHTLYPNFRHLTPGTPWPAWWPRLPTA